MTTVISQFWPPCIISRYVFITQQELPLHSQVSLFIPLLQQCYSNDKMKCTKTVHYRQSLNSGTLCMLQVEGGIGRAISTRKTVCNMFFKCFLQMFCKCLSVDSRMFCERLQYSNPPQGKLWESVGIILRDCRGRPYYIGHNDDSQLWHRSEDIKEWSSVVVKRPYGVRYFERNFLKIIKILIFLHF